MIKTSALQERYTKLQEKMASLKEEMMQESRTLVKDVFAEFFRENPEVYGIGWVQYTPHWNDGEECYFSVHEPHFYLSEDSLEEKGYYGGDDDSWSSLNYYKAFLAKEDFRYYAKETLLAYISEYEKTFKDIDFIRIDNNFQQLKKVIGSIDEDFMEMMYGNHVKVLYTVDGCEVEEHSHD